MLDMKKTSHIIKCKKKVGLKLELGNRAKTEALSHTIYGSFFESCFENEFLIFIKVTKIIIF